ncbi:hypothetical protein Tco_0863899 [Tanacetum coccineum]
MKMYDYGHLEEIEVRRDDQKLYTFKEGDFKRLRLQDIEDMLLLLIQQKLTNLTSEQTGKVPTEMELVLEQTQQGTSYEVSVSAEGVEELKRKVKIKGEKKEALLTLRQKPGQYICCQESQR